MKKESCEEKKRMYEREKDRMRRGKIKENKDK